MKADVIARAWIGTPYVHQASQKGAGADCLGLLRGVWREIHGGEPALVPAYSPDWAETTGAELLWGAARAHLLEKRKDEMAAGDVILFRMRHGCLAKHLGILSNRDGAVSFIHSYSGHGVVESVLTPPWRRRVVACFEFPERKA